MSKKLYKVLLIMRKLLLNKTSFKITKFCFKTTGFQNSKVRSRFQQVLLIAVLLYSGFFELIFIVHHFNDALTAAEAIAPFATGILGIVKGLTMICCLEKAHSLMRRIDNLSDEGLLI